MNVLFEALCAVLKGIGVLRIGVAPAEWFSSETSRNQDVFGDDRRLQGAVDHHGMCALE
jgi:hypothetical protein